MGSGRSRIYGRLTIGSATLSFVLSALTFCLDRRSEGKSQRSTSSEPGCVRTEKSGRVLWNAQSAAHAQKPIFSANFLPLIVLWDKFCPRHHLLTVRAMPISIPTSLHRVFYSRSGRKFRSFFNSASSRKQACSFCDAAGWPLPPVGSIVALVLTLLPLVTANDGVLEGNW